MKHPLPLYSTKPNRESVLTTLLTTLLTTQGDVGSDETIKAKLHGEASDALGAVSAIAQGSVAITLSKGGARKTYEHTDPNEDGAAFAIGPAGVLVAVVDCHSGRDAARIAINVVLYALSE